MRSSTEHNLDIQPSYTSDPDQPYAALDLGSNSFHLIVVRETDEGQLQVIDKHREVVRLASGLDHTHELSSRSMTQALLSLERLGERLRYLPSHNVRIVGTNALRKARNRDAFIAKAEEILRHRIEIISGREEARLIYLGVSHSLEDKFDNRLVVDIGGGSTEVILGRQFQPRLMDSLFIGCISLSERWFANGCVTRENYENARQQALQEMEVIERIYARRGWDVAIGTSGTILAVLHAFGPERSKVIQREMINELEARMIDAGHVDNFSPEWVSKSRAAVFPGGVAILAAIFDAFALPSMEVSYGSLREGLLHDLLGRVHDADIRQQSVEALRKRYRVDKRHSTRVATTASLLLQKVAAQWQLDPEDDGNLLRWAALLHELGMDISHTSYHKHGAYILGNSDLPGFSLYEQHVLADLVRTHRRKFPTEEVNLPMQTAKLSVLLRLAVVLHRNRSHTPLPELDLRATDEYLMLCIPKAWLESHKLTRLDLDQEAEMLAKAPIGLKVATVS